jgi:hypothetical protein
MVIVMGTALMLGFQYGHPECIRIVQSVPKVTVHCNIRQTRAPVRSSSRSIALEAAAAQHTVAQ